MEYGTWEMNLDEGRQSRSTVYPRMVSEGIVFESKYKYVYDYIRSEFDAGRVHEATFYTLHEDPQICAVAIDLLTASTQDNVSPGWWEKSRCSSLTKGPSTRRISSPPRLVSSR
jgi:hypothetical protein